jgi:phage gp29-like protein
MPEIGYQSAQLSTWGQLLSAEFESNPDLKWPLSVEVFDKMRREDAQVISVYRAVTLPIRSAKWQIDPAGASDDVVNLVATDLGLPVKGREVAAPVRTKGRFSWEDHLRLALLELVYGASYFEQVYRVEGAQQRLAKLAWRPPRTIEEIEVAADGGLESIKQRGLKDGPITIPVDRLVAYVNEREGGNWVGQSLLRTAYKNWLLKDRLLRVQALTVERNGMGVPVYTGAPVPDGATPEERTAWLESERDAGLKLAKGFRAGDAAGASIPAGATLELKGVTGDLPDADKPIRYHDEQIARAVLAHFLNLGTETGSWALGSTFADFFTGSLNAVARQIQDVTQQHVVEDLVDLNFGGDAPAPRLVCEPIGSEFPATAEAIKSLIDSGALTPDDPLESFLRTSYGLPVRDADSSRIAPTPPEEAPVDPTEAAAAAAVVPSGSASSSGGVFAGLGRRLHLRRDR